MEIILLNHAGLVTRLLEKSIINPIQIINWHLKKLQNMVKNLDKDMEIYFFDELRFGTHSNIGNGWFKKGKVRNNL
ncbi:MAG: hypothetical protein ISQ34_05625 [Rickettsiales bacterium]|nr:hypothetical protein [Rickettsiales bacterium]